MHIEFAPQRTQLAAHPTVEDRFGGAQRSAETRHRSADGRDFYLGGRVSHEINRPVADLLPNRNPLFVDRNTRALKFERSKASLLEKILKMLARFTHRFADYSQRSVRFRFRDEPIKIRRILRDEPHARGVRRQVLR